MTGLVTAYPGLLGLCAGAAVLLAGLPAAAQAPATAPAERAGAGSAAERAAPPGIPVPSRVDPRVRTVAYDPDAVVTLIGHYGYQIMLEFGETERIENVGIGDSLAWQVTPNRRADTLFLKPIEQNAATNMVVVTNLRRYAFALVAEEPLGPDDPELLYRVRFTYPQDEAEQAAAVQRFVPPPATNTSFSVSGSARLVPQRVFDDGERTWFNWPAGAVVPAVFALAADGSESVVNFTLTDGWLAVERTAPAFVLRHGSEMAVVRNEGWREAAPGPDAPPVREPRRRGLGGLFGGARTQEGTPRDPRQ
jgi:type IV secretion system protein VirB9